MRGYWAAELAYHSAQAQIELASSIFELVEAIDLRLITSDGWVESERSGGSVDISDEVDGHYLSFVLHVAATAAHVEAMKATGNLMEAP